MSRFGRLLSLAFGVALWAATPVWGQGDCVNDSQYPTNAVTPDASGAATLIAECNWEIEYSQITGIQAGAYYRFSLSSGGYITVRQGTFDGPVLAQGYGIVDALAATTDDLYPHWNIDETCATQQECVITNVQLFGDCGPVLAFAEVVEDCDQQNYVVNVDVISAGSGSVVNITYTVSGITNTFTGIGTGVFQMGPYFFGESVEIIVEHESDPGCNMDLGTFQESGECPIGIFCGAPASMFNHCYSNNEQRVWNYVADAGTGSLVLTFLSGSIMDFGDVLTIYDGTDDTAPVLYTNPNGLVTDLGGVVVVSTTGALHVTLTTDGFDSCDDGAVDPWAWQVQCLNCQLPQATATNVDDCVTNSFTIPVDVTSLGDAASVDIIYSVNGGAPTVMTGVGLGVTDLGPFTINDVVTVIVQHGSDPACSVALGAITDSGDCPNIIVCGTPPLMETFCYNANENRSWTYQISGGGTLRLRFLRGTIESNTWDDVAIYDGTDATGTQLFVHNNTTTYNLGPVGSAVNNGLTNYYNVQVYSTTGSLYMEMSSDGSVQCGQPFPSTDFDSWEWDVVCLDCTVPAGTVALVEDCANGQFSLDVDVTSTGDGSTVTVGYTVDGGTLQEITGAGLGITTIGPFTLGEIVNISLAHESDALCDLSLGNFTDSGTCPLYITCGAQPLGQNYCYDANDVRSWTYESVGTGTLRLTFLRGTIESNTFDDLAIYDGTDATGPQLFVHNITTTYNLGPVGSAVNNALTTYYAVQVYSTTGSLYMEMSSDGSVQCGQPFPSTNFDSWEWEVVCLDCTIPAGTVAVVDDCANNEYSLDVDITSTGDGATATISYTIDGGAPQDITGLGTGVTTIGPFAFGEVVNVTIAHESNSLCNIPMGDFTETGTCPELITCGTPFDVSSCYANNDDLRWYFQGTGTFPLGIFFSQGTVFAGDLIEVYDGGDITAPLLYSGNGTATDVTGLFFYTTNPDHRLCVRLLANGFTDCASSATQDPVMFTVDCLDCVPPTGTFSIVQDCANFQYSISVDLTSLGSDNSMEITNDGGAPEVTANAPGIYLVGPFTSGTPVQITVVNDANSLCNIYSGVMVNPLCPTILCGATPLTETYCYTNAENRAWAWAAPSAGATLTLAFQIGTIESNTWDNLRIYDGPDATSPLLFEHGTATSNLGPTGSAVNSAGAVYETVNVSSTGQNLYMTLTSDASVSCATNGATYDSWIWDVSCTGCAAPGVSYNLTADCFHRNYMAEVIITAAPSAQGMTIENVITGQTQNVTGTGVFNFGPYATDSLSIFGITDLSEPGCTWLSDSLTYPAVDCHIVSCGFDNYDYCYGNDEDRWYTFRSALPVPTTIAFLQGTMPTGDRIVIYNGADETANVIYQGNNGGNLTGFAVNSQNANNTITLRIQSNSSASCDDGQVTVPLRWTVGCGAVGIEELESVGFAVYPNPTEGLLNIAVSNAVSGAARVRVLDMSGRTVMESPLVLRSGAVHAIDMRGLQTGQYAVQLSTTDWTKVQRVQVER